MYSSKRVVSTLCSSRVRVRSWIRVLIHIGRYPKNIPGASNEWWSVTKMGHKHCAHGKISRWCYSTLLCCLWCFFFVSDIGVLIQYAFLWRKSCRGNLFLHFCSFLFPLCESFFHCSLFQERIFHWSEMQGTCSSSAIVPIKVIINFRARNYDVFFRLWKVSWVPAARVAAVRSRASRQTTWRVVSLRGNAIGCIWCSDVSRNIRGQKIFRKLNFSFDPCIEKAKAQMDQWCWWHGVSL